MVWRLLCLGLGLMELRIILQQVLFTSCAAGTSIQPVVGLGTLASTATGGRPGLTLMLPPLTASVLTLAMSARRTTALVTMVSPSTALVLY